MTSSHGFEIKIDGTPLADDLASLVVSAFVDDSRHLPDMFSIRFRDPDRIVVKKTAVEVGSKLVVAALAPGAASSTVLIDGEVTALDAEFDTSGTFTILRGFDPAHRLFRGRHTETYTQVTASDVATKIAKRAGVSVGTIDATRTVFDHVSQCGMTDWEFLSGIAREIGYQLAVREGKFEFRKPAESSTAPAASPGNSSDPLVLHLGSDLLSFRSTVTSADQVKEVEVRGWDVAQKKALTSTAQAKTSSASLPTVSPEDLAHRFGDPTLVSADVPYRTQAEVDSAAVALADDVASAFAEFTGVARGNPELKAGAAFSVADIGAPWEGKYTISGSRHSYDPTTGYTNMIAVTGSEERSIFGLTTTPGKGTLPGVVVGQVSDANDPEKLGRIKVTYPWLSDSYVSDWARTVQPGAGPDRGATVVPEVGDEVLVAFEHDMRRPYVLGGLFNGVDKAAEGKLELIDGSGAVNRRSFVSRLGHRLDFFDKKGQTDGITAATAEDSLYLQLDAANTKVTVHSDGSVLVEGSSGIVIDAGGSKLELKGSEVSVTAQGTLNLKGAQTTLEGSAQTQVKGGSMCSVSAQMVKIN
jgi:phage protein D